MMSGICGRKGRVFIAEGRQEWKMKIVWKVRERSEMGTEREIEKNMV